MDVDMDLLRLVGELRSAIPELGVAGASAPSARLVVEVGERVAGAHPQVAPALETLVRGAPGGELEAWQASAEAVLEALEAAVFDPLDGGATSTLERRVLDFQQMSAATHGSVVGFPGTGPEEKRDVEVAEGPRPDPSLHSVAAYLVHMDPEVMESLVVLRDSLEEVERAWTGSNEVRRQFQERLRDLEAVLGSDGDEGSLRSETVDLVGDVLEIAMMEREESAGDPGAAPVDQEEVTGPLSPAAIAGLDPGTGGIGQVPASPNAGGADPDLVLDFVAEGLDYLEQAEAALLRLEADPADAEAINVTFRAFHTIKGVSAFLDFTQVAHVAHEVETLLSSVRDGSLAFTEVAADLFLRSADILRSLLVGIREAVDGGTPTEPEGIQEFLALLAEPDLARRVGGNVPLGLQRQGVHAEGEAKPADRARSDAREDGVRIDGTPGGAASAEDSVRIRTERLDRLVDLVGELVVSHSMIAQDPEILVSRSDLGKKVVHSQKILRELQDLSTSLRMVPLKPAFHKVSRVVRDVSRKSGKRVELVTMGEETELDRSMVGVITDPLVHMVRNSVDHGIEGADERLAAGKPAHGTLHLTARQAGGNVVVEIRDDGRGLNRDKILAKAVERGLVDGDRALSDDEIFQLVFQPGFSTADAVTDLSGRGVGMDVVKRAVESLRGRIEIRTESGVGTCFSIYLPLTLAITDGMLVRVGLERYIIPTMKIQLSFRPEESDLWSVSARGEMVMLHGQLIPIVRLHRLFELVEGQADPTSGILVVVGEGSRRTALLVDELLGQQQFVVKALTGAVSGAPGVAGGAILGDGGVGLILDPDEVIELGRLAGGAAPGSRRAVA